jgi:hypothetical protein
MLRWMPQAASAKRNRAVGRCVPRLLAQIAPQFESAPDEPFFAEEPEDQAGIRYRGSQPPTVRRRTGSGASAVRPDAGLASPET